ncbi:MAG: hypothetical protein OXG34_15685 [bacterium]|nr:hypothetical protein [bacterium]MCY3888966.1 hypothetical protein [bacterium]MCY3963082.1 hypothetical protein [bacterium]MCY4133726.1 hypothetical protein [bacterium]
MATETIAQILTVLIAVLGIIWHQQRSTEKLRDDFNRAINGLRDDHNGLRQEVVSNGQRLARIEGFLRIGMPAPAEAASTEAPASEPVSVPPAPGIEPAAND